MRIETPVKDISMLKSGDMIELTGTIVTARDEAHKYLLNPDSRIEDIKRYLRDGIIYHCGPIADKTILAAGPTTSMRQEPYTEDVIRRYGVKMVIGKGGMGKKTVEAMKGRAVYCKAIGGNAQLLARRIRAVKELFLRELGDPEAIWILDVERFPAIVTIDSCGHSLHDKIEKGSEEVLTKLKNDKFKY